MQKIAGFPHFIKTRDGGLVNLSHVARIRVQQHPTSQNWALVVVVPGGSTEDGSAIHPVLFASENLKEVHRARDSLLLMLRSTGNVTELIL